jgi:hypothetical protein
MWLLHLLPTSFLSFVVDFTLGLGIFLTILTFIIPSRLLRLLPFLASYHLALQILSIVILVTGVYFKGGYSTEMIWRDKVAALEKEIEKAEAKSREKTVEIQEKIVTETKVIREKGKDIVRYIDRYNDRIVDREVIKKEEIIKYIENCPVPPELIDLHNRAVDINKAAEGKK